MSEGKSTVFQPQTAIPMAGYNSIGRVIDKLVREHQLAMRGGYTTEKPNEGERPCRERTDRHPTKKTR